MSGFFSCNIKAKMVDMMFVIIAPLVMFLSVFFFDFRVTYLESLIIVFGIPSAYLSFRSKEKVKKVALFSFLVSVPVALLVELVAFWDHAWVIPHSVFSFRILGFSPLENYLWQFLTVYMVLIFYEHFCNKEFQSDFSKRTPLMLAALYALTFVVIILFSIKSSLLRIPYPYIWLCVPLFVMPIILFLARYPRFFRNFLKVQFFFLYIHLIFELIGVKLNHWVYPSSHYIGWVTLLGQRFPVEEFLFVMLCGAFAACTYYEYFTSKNMKDSTLNLNL